MAIKADHTAAVKRAAKYGITLREDGHLTKPSEFADVPDESFGDPANYAYPCDTVERARAAVAYWGQRKEQAEYTPADRAIIEARIKKLATALGVTVAAFTAPVLSHDETAKLLATALGVSTYDIQDVYPDSVIYSQYPGGVETAQSERKRKLYQTPYSIMDGKVTLGEKKEVTRRSVYDPVVKMTAEFSATAKGGQHVPSSEGVSYTGKVFEIGDYPDKDFALSEAEADAAIAAFTPVANDYEHHNGLFDGKLGTLQRVWRDGVNLMGEMLIPSQVRALAGSTLQTSLSWARDSKQIIGNALTATPRVTDATLTAAFTAATIPNKEKKQMTLKEKFLALFTGGKKPEDLTEDELVKFADAEFPTNAGGAAKDAGKSKFAKGKKEPATADCPDCGGSGDCALCDGAGQVAADASDDDLTAKRAKAGYAKIDTKKGKEDGKKADMTAPVEDPVITGIKAQQLRSQAEALFSTAMGKGKVLPAQQAPFVTLFTALHKADNAGVVTFSVDGSLKNGAGVQALSEFLGALPENPALFAEMLQTEAAKGNLLTFATPAGGGGKPSDERMAELRKMGGLAK